MGSATFFLEGFFKFGMALFQGFDPILHTHCRPPFNIDGTTLVEAEN